MVKDKRAVLAPAPVVVLVEPQMGENIGAAARAMLNFGLTALRLVNPRDGWPNPKANAMASGAGMVIDGVRVFDTVEAALADMSCVYATTARKREMLKPVLTPAEAAGELYTRIGGGEACAILFGGERAGLSTSAVDRADAILSIPVNPAFSSLNLGQAVNIVAYEWSRRADFVANIPSDLDVLAPASKEDLFRLFTHLETELEDADYFHPPEKREAMTRTLRTALTRARLTEKEVQSLRGVVKALARGRGARYVRRDAKGDA